MIPTLHGFSGEYRFLSNYYNVRIVYKGGEYGSTEAAYQAAKCSIEAEKRWFLKATPPEAKKLGRRIAMKSDWNSIKDTVMLELLRIKFKEETLKSRLIKTKGMLLEETNYWNDRYWGVCNGTGENRLGKLLMRVRDELESASTMAAPAGAP